MSQTSAFGVGDMVRHARFGAGEVVAAGGGRVIVRFGTVEKTFVPEIAPLTKAAGGVAVADEDETTARRKLGEMMAIAAEYGQEQALAKLFASSLAAKTDTAPPSGPRASLIGTHTRRRGSSSRRSRRFSGSTVRNCR